MDAKRLHRLQGDLSRFLDAVLPDLGRQGARSVHNAATFVGTEGWVSIAYEKVVTHPASLMASQIAPGEIHLHDSALERKPAGLAQGHPQFATAGHHQDWLASVKSRKDPVDPIESAVHSDLISHLSDICIRTGRPIRWDPVRQTIAGDAEARKMMSRPMRAPWRLA
jgi:hypothetical protein